MKAGRTVAELRASADSLWEKRSREEAKLRAEEKARQEREAAEARKKYLDSLVGRESELWSAIEDLISAKNAKSYDFALKHLLDLKDLDARKKGDFRIRVEALRQKHARKPAFVNRLNKAGL